MICCVLHMLMMLCFSPLSVPLADGRCADVRCCARGGRGCAAVSADHCQLITVQPTQALALREPLHGPHQRGRCFSTCSPLWSSFSNHSTFILNTYALRKAYEVEKLAKVNRKKRNMNKRKRLMYVQYVCIQILLNVHGHAQLLPRRAQPSWA